jgi:hypothetical protein
LEGGREEIHMKSKRPPNFSLLQPSKKKLFTSLNATEKQNRNDVSYSGEI